ncbi:MAG: radical SAM family heme chaperone HemW, partial [Gammaproteobacteria bacterium]|nr:radical SAM family heme chaperone HemW [Gammaproteobacteria bacterium]
NSHALHSEIPEDRYVDALLNDLASQKHFFAQRPLQSIFFGGGTPSLFSPDAIQGLTTSIGNLVEFEHDIEITLEANPGTIDNGRFEGFRAAGVNRLSIGVQSFDDKKLKSLGRIHGSTEATRAVQTAIEAGFDNFNLDLMYGLPDQTLEQALSDLHRAIALRPTHLSVYQLTLEPNTLFHHNPPVLPDGDTLWAMHQAIADELSSASFDQYEVSAFALSGRRCNHNQNYWLFGDYIGIGAGAHGKITTRDHVMRTTKEKHPERYLNDSKNFLSIRVLERDEISFEFLLNAFRLRDGFDTKLFEQRTGENIDIVESALDVAVQRGLLDRTNKQVRATDLGFRFLNDLLELFLPEPRKTTSTMA